MLQHLINLLFPILCAGCKGILLGTEETICTNCRHEIPLTNHFVDYENDASKVFYGRIDLVFVATLFYFQKQGLVQEIIYSLKYRGNQNVGKVLGFWIGQKMLPLTVTKTFDYIVPVPLHPRKLRQRGYNQVTKFGESLSEILGVDFNDRILRRNIYSKSQTKKKSLSRNTVNTAIFEANFTENNHNKHFLIIDDVLTTGTTIESCAKALQKIPGAKISVVCMAFTH